MQSRLSTLLFVSLLLAGPAVGADRSFFVLAKVGQASVDLDPRLRALDTLITDEGSWGAGVGYRLNGNWAFQAEVLNFGSVWHTRLCGPPESLCLSPPPVAKEYDGLSVSVVPRFPLSRRAWVFGKLGLVRLHTKATSLGRIESDVEEDEVHYGAGISFELWTRLSLLAEVEAAGSGMSNVSVGASFEF